jgi:predicted enzyme related to lactoylglutathione lyase
MGLGFKTMFVALAAEDLSTLKSFYQGLFEKDPVVDIPNVYAEFQLSGLRLGLFKPKAGHGSEFELSTKSGMSLCIEVEDLEGAIAHITALGSLPLGPIQHASHGREIYAYDPNGNRLILHETSRCNS